MQQVRVHRAKALRGWRHGAVVVPCRTDPKSARRSLCDLSWGCATRRLPKLCGSRLPIKRVIAWTVLLQMLDARDSLLDAWPMAGRHPPQHDRWPFKMLKPLGAAAIEVFMDCLPNKALKCIDALPNRKIDDDTRIGIRPRVGSIAALVDIAPDEPGAPVGNAVHQGEIVGEIRHARIVDLVSSAANVEFCEMMIGWLLQGPDSVADKRDEFVPSRWLPRDLRQDIALNQTKPEQPRREKGIAEFIIGPAYAGSFHPAFNRRR